MSSSNETQRDLLNEVKEAFSQLGLQQKFTFLTTETVNTAVEALYTAFDVVCEECTELFNTTPEETAEDIRSEE